MPKKSPRRPRLPPLQTVPDPPDELSDVGQTYWRRVAKLLVDNGILTELHLEALRVLCETWEEYRQLADELRGNPEGRVFTTESGYQGESPTVRMRDRALAALQKMWAKFGLTPHSLTTLNKSGGGHQNKQSRLQAFSASKYGGKTEPQAARPTRPKPGGRPGAAAK